MKTVNVTVVFSRTVQIQIDETRVGDESYLHEKRIEAIELAGAELNVKSGIVRESDEPSLVE